jgi:hypothetical protein
MKVTNCVISAVVGPTTDTRTNTHAHTWTARRKKHWVE